MSSTRVKICGITSLEDGLLAAEAGAFAIGLNLYPKSKRCVSPTLARQISRGMPQTVEAFVLLVNEPIETAITIAEPISRTIQWHGDDPPLPPPEPWRFVPAFNIATQSDVSKVVNYLDRCRDHGRLPTAVLLDGHAPGQYGGTGQTAPWDLLAGFDPGVPVILAGGMTPENVADAIRVVRPYAIDVAGGVESGPGRKDPAKMQAFLDAVKVA